MAKNYFSKNTGSLRFTKKTYLTLSFLFLSFLGFSQASDLFVSGNNILIPNGDITPGASDNTDFGTVEIGSTLDKTFRLGNNAIPANSSGAAQTFVRITFSNPSITITGTDAALFSIISGPSSGNTLEGNSYFSPDLVIRFTPTLVAGTKNATVTVRYTNNLLSYTYTFSIRGTSALAPEINIQGNGASIVDGDTTPTTADWTDFSSTTIGVGTTKTYTIQNTGSANLTIGAISFSGTNASDYSVTTAPSTPVTAGSSTTFVVTFTPSAAGVRTATLSIINNDSNENPYNFNIQGTGTLAPLTNGPGGVTTDLQLWLRSDLLNGTTGVADNTNVSSWGTQGRGTNASVNTVGQEPKYWNNATKNINFNAVVDFTNDYNNAPNETTYNNLPQQYLEGASGYYSQDMFIVAIPDVPITSTIASMDMFCGDSPDATSTSKDGSGIGYGKYSVRTDDEVISYSIGTTPSTSTPIADRGYGVAQTSTTVSYSNVGIINTRNNNAASGQKLYYNGSNINTSEVGVPQFINLNNTRYWIGRSQAYRGSLDARVAEVITYSSRKNDATERSNIQSYLAIKYGITLGVNGTSMNYTNSAGTTIWDATANVGYNNDITGIGRDDLSKLNQKQSKSVNTSDEITIGLADIYTTNTANTNTFDTDKKFLVWGNNRGTLAAQTPVIVNISSGITSPSTLTSDVSFVSVGRTWKVIQTGGNVPIVKVSIPSTMLTATITPPGDYLMFISDTPVFNPTAEYRVMTVNGSNLETTYDFDGTKYITFGYAPERTFVRCIKFDGVDDYLDAGKVLNLNTSFTVSAWVNRNSSDKTILSKRNSTFSQGYDLSINSAGKAEMSWMVGATKHTITSNAVIPSGKWHHIGVIYNGSTTTAKMYIDGVTTITNTSMPNVPATTESFLIAAADGVSPTSLFNGSIDEVRVWNVALTEAQFRYVMNQEILSNTTLTNGAIVPNTITLNDISSVPWANLNAYYPMSTYTYTNAKDISNYKYTAALRNLTTVDLQTAPLPYESAINGNWETIGVWTNSTVQDLPYSTSIEDPTKIIDWNIVKVKNTHTITSVGNKKVLGLFVEPTANLIATTTGGLQTDGTKIEVSHYLKLDGKIDLVGRSQLIQKLGSDIDATSSGSLERDQQGQSNKYNYNYWSSPVGAMNATTNNNAFTVAGVLKDGTNPAAPAAITWVSGYDGATSPFSLARYWIYKFDNLANDYANWTQIGETGILSASKGFTLKGPGTVGTQNLTFLGKPNNGTIINTVLADQLLLIGNPYPSALDADKFITDNIGSIDTSITDPAIDGALYFWEHYTTNNTHILRDYQGGYGIRNLSGGVAPSATGVDFISGSGAASKLIPNQFIPVGQGFFVAGKAGTGGTVTFNNSQRDFHKEDEAGVSQTTYRIPVSPKASSHWTDNSNAPIEKDTHKKIRLGFNVIDKTFHRQVLLAFMDEKATSEMDNGYDAFNIDDSPSDMYLLNGENELAIQGEGYFDEDASFPIAVRTEATGKVSFGIDALENFDESQNVFIFDKETDTYNSIKNRLYEVELPQGYFTDRFSLRFTDKTLGVKDLIYENSIQVVFTSSNNVLNITNGANDNTVVAVSLFNIQGKLMSKWELSDKEQTSIKIPIQNKTSGVYIVKLKTTKGNINKKIIIK
ncbi:choice-of-anchor D domain-containing protein [Flavobacterium yafengii]|uniref:choice-of-anchor D domain-containing protein n=1 Tax=Flavobacterium yafengii TaxID=3041253 RepID=UPI0024A88B15|nr:choice-of-anchor D domain-containing protein [Flavobacterium yafengii]MDI6046468.1 choice-of-anchor D domain-containing protein [Flavobacterium yafengii]